MSKFILLANVSENDDDSEGGPILIERIGSRYGEEVAARVARTVGEQDAVLLHEEKWAGEARLVPGHLVVFAEEVDWDQGSLRIEIDRDTSPQFEGWEEFQNGDKFSLMSTNLREMCFEFSEIELLAPGGVLKPDSTFENLIQRPKGGPGRRREHDWEGALFYLMGEAEKNSIAPDPDAHGAQADIKRRLADWFSEHGGKVPADSQLQAYAAKALNSIRGTKP